MAGINLSGGGPRGGDLERFVAWLFATLRKVVVHVVLELRGLGSGKGTISGYYDDPAALIRAAEEWSGRAAGVYITLAAVKGDLLARAANRVAEWSKATTRDEDVVRRLGILLDFDPVRPSGIPSTEEEHRAALDKAKAVRNWLVERGLPRTSLALVDSGNGAHCLVLADIGIDKDSTDLARRFIEAIAARFSDTVVKVDRATFNASRLARLPGTLNKKGEGTPARPHRIARAIELPENPEFAPRGLVESIASEVPAEGEARGAPAAAAPGRPPAPSRDVREAVERWNADHPGDWPRSGGTCPACHHNGCFGAREGGLARWACFSSNHGRDSNGCGRKGQRCWTGDALDLAANARGVSRSRVLVEDGYLVSRSSGRGASGPGCYRAEATGMVLVRRSHDGSESTTPITNFLARITTEVIRDDGAETEIFLQIEAELEGQYRFLLPAAKFSAMNWPIEHLGARAVIFPGFNLREHARTAIQQLSEGVERRTVYGHLGWRKVNGTWVYLHAGGAIGSSGPVEGVEVEVTGGLERFVLPTPPEVEALRAAIRASFGMLGSARGKITVPLLCATYRAALGQADFSVHLTGKTGGGKTSLALLAEQHWAPTLDEASLPGNWSSTANSIEGLAFYAKDTLLLVDDFAPSGSSHDIQRAHREADRIFRAQGNRTGRQRMRADGTLRPSKPPRGTIVSTGETTPRGQSVRARALILEQVDKDIDWERLTACQQDAKNGLYAQAMAGFVRWLAPRYEEIRARLRAERDEIRRASYRPGQHRRTPGIVADLMIGARYFLEFARESGAITEEENAAHLQRFREVLDAVAEDQEAHQRAADPVDRFLDLMVSAFATGVARVASPSGGVPAMVNIQEGQKIQKVPPDGWGWEFRWGPSGSTDDGNYYPKGDLVGWLEEGVLFLDPNAALRAVQKMIGSSGEALAISPRTLGKRLRERGLLLRTDETRGENTVRETLDNVRRRVLVLRVETFFPPEEPAPHGAGADRGAKSNG